MYTISLAGSNRENFADRASTCKTAPSTMAAVPMAAVPSGDKPTSERVKKAPPSTSMAKGVAAAAAPHPNRWNTMRPVIMRTMDTEPVAMDTLESTVWYSSVDGNSRRSSPFHANSNRRWQTPYPITISESALIFLLLLRMPRVSFKVIAFFAFFCLGSLWGRRCAGMRLSMNHLAPIIKPVVTTTVPISHWREAWMDPRATVLLMRLM
mmetsp:Transcript_32353/g.54283  ORF Transcript_32353/g.54283 Transcript_32353/m.54283 type:complete len:209 (+) Transcript_32353:839-1465(+)